MANDNIIILNDDEGREVEFEFLDLIPYRSKEYVSFTSNFGRCRRSCYFAT